MHELALDVFGEEVGRVHISRMLEETEVPSLQTFLGPKLAHGQMPHLSEAVSPANPNGGRGVGPDDQFTFQPQITKDTLKSQSLAGSFLIHLRAQPRLN